MHLPQSVRANSTHKLEACIRKVESLRCIGRFNESVVYSVEWLNYHHLLYFWTVARTGSISAARESESLKTVWVKSYCVLLPLGNTALLSDLEEWFHSQNARPAVMGEFAALALLRVFAEGDLALLQSRQ